ncbi:MAG: helix-turn-helix transcriptional regulator [Planctomycetes bacterium]|nr:helix-turn-helix transcriptional regulator [Planctomycetota bacterium]
MASVEFGSTPAGAGSFPIAITSPSGDPASPEEMDRARAAPRGVSPDRSACADRRQQAARPLHRIREVRLEQGLTLRTVARHMGVPVRVVRAQEEGHCDLRLSDLLRWQEVLGAPLEDLVRQPHDCLSRPVMERAQLVRLMKTAAALLESAPTPATARLAQTLVEQLVEMMPELEQVNPWHAVGQRRSLDELGRAAERPLSDDVFRT